MLSDWSVTVRSILGLSVSLLKEHRQTAYRPANFLSLSITIGTLA